MEENELLISMLPCKSATDHQAIFICRVCPLHSQANEYTSGQQAEAGSVERQQVALSHGLVLSPFQNVSQFSKFYKNIVQLKGQLLVH